MELFGHRQTQTWKYLLEIITHSGASRPEMAINETANRSTGSKIHILFLFFFFFFLLFFFYFLGGGVLVTHTHT